MLECEVKLLNIDREHVIDRLTKLGAVFVHDELVVDIYLRRDILRKQKAHARVRCTKARTVLTVKYKLPAKAAKLAYEVDTLLPDALVEDYGTQARWEVIDHVRVKKRTTYTRGGYRFDIDQYRGLPTLLEIEGPNEKQLHQTIKDLGLDQYTQFCKGAKSLYDHYDITLPTVSSSFLTRLLAVIRSS